MQTEKAKSSHFDRMRGFKNQIFPTLIDLCFTYYVLGIINSRLFAERIFQNFKFDESLFEENITRGVAF